MLFTLIFLRASHNFYGWSVKLFPLALRILTGKKYRQIKLQLLQKVRIWVFGLLVHQTKSL